MKNNELTFGQKAVGLTFNPNQNPDVFECKQKFAELIDFVDKIRKKEGVSSDVIRHASIAIEGLESAQMRAVKALTIE